MAFQICILILKTKMTIKYVMRRVPITEFVTHNNNNQKKGVHHGLHYSQSW